MVCLAESALSCLAINVFHSHIPVVFIAHVVISGIFIGQTGSYIFSQTLFTYRTGCHTRWVGVFCAIFFLSTVFSSVNFLEIIPLFFLGSTLVFLGTDLLFIWLVEVRHKVSCYQERSKLMDIIYLYYYHCFSLKSYFCLSILYYWRLSQRYKLWALMPVLLLESL